MAVDKTTYDDWFKAQFGDRPSPRPLRDLEWEATSAMLQAERAKIILESTRLWDHRFNDCLYAWQAAQHNNEE